MAVQAAEKDGIVSIWDLQGKRAKVICGYLSCLRMGLRVLTKRTVMSVIRRLL